MLEFFSFKGRTSRLGCWRIYLVSTLLTAVAWLLGIFAISLVGPVGGALFIGLVPAYAIVLATSVRRLHDRGKNIWWWLLFQVAPLLLMAPADLLQSRDTPVSTLISLPLVLGSLGLFIWGFVEMGCLRGDPQPNRYGEVAVLGR